MKVDILVEIAQVISGYDEDYNLKQK
jgi:hypothetical protein